MLLFFGGLFTFILLLHFDCIKEKGVPSRVYTPFALTFMAFSISFAYSVCTAACILAVASCAVIFQSIQKTKRFDINCIITTIALISTIYHIISYISSFSDVEYDSWWFRTLLISTFIQYMFMFEDELAKSGMLGTSMYFVIFYAILSPMLLGKDLRDICRAQKYADGKIIFCAKVTDTEYDRDKKEYLVTTDYQMTDTSYFTFVADLADGAQISKGKTIILERAYNNPKISSDVNFAPLAGELKEYEQPVVEKGGKQQKLIWYIDTDFFSHNMRFVCHHCGLHVVYKAANKGVTDDGKLRYDVTGTHEKPMTFHYKPSTTNASYSPDTLLFMCNVDSRFPRNPTCLESKVQFRQNFAKITDYGFYFRDGLFSRQEIEKRFPQIKEYTSVLKP